MIVREKMGEMFPNMIKSKKKIKMRKGVYNNNA
jgi:hypothetical protein